MVAGLATPSSEVAVPRLQSCKSSTSGSNHWPRIWQKDGKERAPVRAFGTGADTNTSLMLLHDLSAEPKSNTRTLRSFRCIEGFEDPRQHVRWNARAGVTEYK